MAEGSQTDNLCNASARGDLPQVLLLLENGADINGYNKYGRTALQVVKLGAPAVAEALLKAGARPNLRDPVCGLTVMHDAAREGFADMVLVLLAYGANVNLVDTRGNLPLHLAAREGHLEAVKLLIGSTADPRKANGLGYTACQLALAYNKLDTAAYITEYLNQ
ncbi:cyclin-dependent kinase 4 inhibitor C [Genypterus blacodes]|uniref:cyclin-dependent kinase 4 inhibitor C n=1 Tax=Genypterus blacodes TaxID=154954 RepID=UPI003F76A47D